MLIPGTQMHIVTFIFVSIELVILFYLVIYKLSRPDDPTAPLNITLIALLIIYNVTGGLLPDPNMPGSTFVQEIIAYGTGFITPCFFPYYVYKAFGLQKMKFHAFTGVFLCLLFPYLLFVITYAATGKVEDAKNLLILPVSYAAWVIYSLVRAIKYKYRNNIRSKESKQEITVLLLSLIPWIGLPVVSYFNLSQAAEAGITNPGFLILLALQVSRHIMQLRAEYQRLIDSEHHLLHWNTRLQNEVNKRTRELEKINEEKTTTFVNLAHETKTPLTLINNYLEEYINRNGETEELIVVKKNVDKLSNDIVNFFDIERFNKGIPVYNHSHICSFSDILRDNFILFKEYAKKRNIELRENIEPALWVKADPVSINRVILNLLENAVKFSGNDCSISIMLRSDGDKIIFSVTDPGIGIPPEMHTKVFRPYYQVTNEKKSNQGMGLGLPIVKKIVEELKAEITIKSDPGKERGTTFTVILPQYKKTGQEAVAVSSPAERTLPDYGVIKDQERAPSNNQTVLIIEDNISMANYLVKKLQETYQVQVAPNGHEALKKMKNGTVAPDLIISDVMMDKLDGYEFVKIISRYPSYQHIPVIFLSARSGQEDKIYGLSLGAIDFIQKPFKITELLRKIGSVLNNAEKQRQAVLAEAFNRMNELHRLSRDTSGDLFKQHCDFYGLTPREIAIVKRIREGEKYKTIGERLFISERTVAKHVEHIFEKLGVTNKIGLIQKLE